MPVSRRAGTPRSVSGSAKGKPKRRARRSSTKGRRIALALAGGGPLGAIYELGVLCALEDSLQGVELHRLDHYVGVSSGGFIAAGLANGMPASEICLAFIDGEDLDVKTGQGELQDLFNPASLLIPAYDEYLRRSLRLPGLLLSAAWNLALGRRSLLQVLERMGPALPAGLFSNREVDLQLARLFGKEGRSNDFRELAAQLTIVATDLDTGEATPFGQPGWDHVPISRAVQASAALPGLFPPVEIDGRHYVDGALKKTLHATVVLEQGVDLLFCINPLVPFNTLPPPRSLDPASFERRTSLRSSTEPAQRIFDGGLAAVLSQTFRSLIHSRMALGMRHYEKAYPDTDIILLEPDQGDARLHQANLFSYRQRRQIAELAFQRTRAVLRSAAPELRKKLERNGLTLNAAALAQADRLLVSPLPAPRARPMRTLRATLDRLELLVAGRTAATTAKAPFALR